MITIEYTARIAAEAVLFEVCATPKPGLVDRVNSGAHSDMDIYTFMSSACAIHPYFHKLALSGFAFEGSGLRELFSSAREIGIEAEKVMLEATDGVNTHRGMIFTMGLACLAAGYLIGRKKEVSSANICECVAGMTKGICQNDLADNIDSNGGRVYRDFGLTGARGEAESGFATVRLYALPALKRHISAGMDVNESLVRTLLCIMENTYDTNVAYRRGIGAAKRLRVLAGRYKEASIKKIEELDNILIRMNISPGGCADLLALTWFLYKIDKEQNPN